MATAATDRQELPHTVCRLVEELIDLVPEIKTVLVEDRGVAGERNPSGDVKKVADDEIDRLLYDRIAPLAGIGEYLSEERAGILEVGSGLSVAVDPLDGSSNIPPNATVGTIVGVYDAPLPAKGRELVASVCLVFGPLTTALVAADGELLEYTVADGEIVDAEAIEIPETGAIWGFSGRPTERSMALQSYTETLRRLFAHRYTGAMIADVRLLLSAGGLVGYPATASDPDGVLRLQYESNPVAYLLEAAGGSASTGSHRVLDLAPDGPHQRTPTFFGTNALVDELETRLADV